MVKFSTQQLKSMIWIRTPKFCTEKLNHTICWKCFWITTSVFIDSYKYIWACLVKFSTRQICDINSSIKGIWEDQFKQLFSILLESIWILYVKWRNPATVKTIRHKLLLILFFIFTLFAKYPSKIHLDSARGENRSPF